LQPLELRALVALLRGHVVTNDLEAAQDTMQAIEKTGKDLAQITRIYFDLGKQLQAELKRIEARNDVAALKRTRDSYVAFLSQMAARKEGQTFATLQWTGEAFFGLELYEQAADRFKEIIEHSNNDPQFLDQSKAQNKGALTQVKLRLVTALRKQNLFDDAWELIKPQKESATSDDPLHKAVVLNYEIVLERGLVLQEWGANEPARLETAIKHWGFWAQRLEPMQQKPTAYFEIRLNLIRCLLKKGTAATDPKDRQESLRQAERQLLYMVKTSDQLGGPTLKAQFQQVQRDLEKQLGRPLQAAEPTPATGKPVAKAP
ncbi:MAG: hypothetical protein HY000_34310, partial [Planctomycetes bacterium]|nr:hypothetical protein [Planctomycetota bacterium]